MLAFYYFTYELNIRQALKSKKGCAWQPFPEFIDLKTDYSSLLLPSMPSATKTPNKAAPLKAMLTISKVTIRPSFIAIFPPREIEQVAE
jgi:hypothetical protein